MSNFLEEVVTSHKADKSFFDVKRPWSKRKDRILGSYLTAYLPKIATQKSPVFIVDAFAGPGQFTDGEPGSPLIISKVIEQALDRGLPVKVEFLCIEPDRELCNELHVCIKRFPFAETRRSTFLQSLDDVEERAKRQSAFLYLDPFTVEGLEWAAMDRVFQKLFESKMSVEVLLNFNAPSFVRRGLAALKLHVPDADPTHEDIEEIDAKLLEPPTIDKLNQIVGGNWWQEMLLRERIFSEQVADIADTFRDRLRTRFSEVCHHAVKALPHHSVPKYYLMFGSRHPDALRLMNDEMVKSRKTLANLAEPKHPTLFETRSEELVPDTGRIPELIHKHSARSIERGKLIVDVIRDAFCDFASSEIRGCIEQMLKKGELHSATGKWRINDGVSVWRP